MKISKKTQTQFCFPQYQASFTAAEDKENAKAKSDVRSLSHCIQETRMLLQLFLSTFSSDTEWGGTLQKGGYGGNIWKKSHCQDQRTPCAAQRVLRMLLRANKQFSR